MFAGGDGHDHGHGSDGRDRHAWLDPDDAAHWLDAVAEGLAGPDPENAGACRADARDGRAEIAEAEALLVPVRCRPLVVSHGAHRRFEERFGVPALGAIAVGDAAPRTPRGFGRSATPRPSAAPSACWRSRPAREPHRARPRALPPA